LEAAKSNEAPRRGAEEKEINKTKVGPPTRKDGSVKRVDFVEPDSEELRPSAKSAESTKRGKGIPYVDVPPLKTFYVTLLLIKSKKLRHLILG
jgi:hypothetical protein